jgi:hypothetical protein
VAGKAGEEFGPEHRGDRRAVAAGRLAGDAAEAVRVVVRIDERDDLVAEIGVVPAAAVRVDELRATDGRPGIDEDDPRVDVLPVDQLEKGRPEGGTVSPHLELSGEALKHVHGRTARIAVRRENPQRPFVRIAERVPAQRLACDHVLGEPAAQLACPGAAHVVILAQLRGIAARAARSSSKLIGSRGCRCARIGSWATWRFRTP